jgi:aspartate kinase
VKIVVMKFGGTSVASAEEREQAVGHVLRAANDGYAPVVVVSAMGRGPDPQHPYATDTLLDLLRRLGGDPEARSRDLLMACGEIVSAVIMAHLIATYTGLPAVPLTGGQAGILTDDHFGHARILDIRPDSIRRCLDRGQVPVVAGFQGVTEGGDGAHGDITTLGRGGSDTTASALGVALQADAVEIYTDVDGVMTADPRIVKDARTLPTISYEEICEMAHQGAKVLHPRSVEIAMEGSVRLRVRQTTSAKPGTLVTHAVDAGPRHPSGVTGIAHSGPVRQACIRLPNAQTKREVEPAVYEALANAGIPIYFVSGSVTDIDFVVDATNVANATAALDGIAIPSTAGQAGQPRRCHVLNARTDSAAFKTQSALLSRDQAFDVVPVTAEFGTNRRIVSLIGLGLRSVPGVMAMTLDALDARDIELLQVGGSANALSCLIHEEDMEEAIRGLHTVFNLGTG